MHKGDHVGAQLRVGHVGGAAGLDQAVAEHDAVLLVGQRLGQLGVGVRDHLEGGLEEARHHVAHQARGVAKEGHTDGHVAHHGGRLAAELVDDGDIRLGQKHRVVDQQQAHQPAPAVEATGGEEACGSGHQHAGDSHGLDEGKVPGAAHDGGDGVEDPGQGVDVAVGVDLEHAGCLCLGFGLRSRAGQRWR